MTRGTLRVGGAVVAVVALSLWATSGHAAPGDATRLEYARSARAARCPDRDALKNAVSKRLGYDPFFPAARQTIVVEITDVNDGLQAKMNLVDDQGMIVGSRELRDSAENCDELVASLALAISIALDPSAALGSESNAPENTETIDHFTSKSDPTLTGLPEQIPAVPRAVRERPKGKPKPVRAQRLAQAIRSNVRAAGFSTLGVVPSLAFGVRVGTGMRWGWFQVLAEFADQLPATHDTGADGSVRASLYEGTLAPCFVRGVLAACAELSFGSLRSEGRDIPYPAKGSSLYAAAGLRIEFTPRLLGRLHLLVAADALKSLSPITLRLRGEEIWRTPLLSAGIALGLELQFP